MDAQNEHPQGEQGDGAHLNDFGKIAVQFLQYGQNASNNITAAFGEMSARDWLRLIIVAGAYLLLRPHAMKYLGKRQVEKMEEEDAKEKARISANELRTGKKSVEDEYMDADTSAADWGERARTRQRVMLKNLMEAEERRKQDEEDDKDIADLLED